MMNEVQVFNGLKVKEENGQVMFDAETAAIGLGLVDTSKGTTKVRWSRINQYLNLTKDNKVAKGDTLTRQQVILLISRIRNARSFEFAKSIGINTAELTIPSIEQDVLSKIIKAFPNEHIALQKTVLGKYKLDLYFPDYGLAIEVDEFGHSDRAEKYDEEREQEILRKTKVNRFVRINPDSKRYDIFDSIGFIHSYISNNQIAN